MVCITKQAMWVTTRLQPKAHLRQEGGSPLSQVQLSRIQPHGVNWHPNRL